MDDENGVSRMSRLFEVTMNLMRAVSSFVVFFLRRCDWSSRQANRSRLPSFAERASACTYSSKKKLKENNKTRTPRTNTIIALRVFCSFVCSFFRWIRSSFFFSWRQMKEKDLRCFLFFFPIAPSSFTPKYCVLFLFVFFCFFWLWLRIDFFDEPAHREQNPTTDEEEEKRRRANRNSCVFGQPFCLVWVCVCVCVCVCECALTGPRLVLIVFVSAFPKNGFTNYLQKYNSSIEIHRQSIVS